MYLKYLSIIESLKYKSILEYLKYKCILYYLKYKCILEYFRSFCRFTPKIITSITQVKEVRVRMGWEKKTKEVNKTMIGETQMSNWHSPQPACDMWILSWILHYLYKNIWYKSPLKVNFFATSYLWHVTYVTYNIWHMWPFCMSIELDFVFGTWGI